MMKDSFEISLDLIESKFKKELVEIMESWADKKVCFLIRKENK